jgi:hypothetical protein
MRITHALVSTLAVVSVALAQPSGRVDIESIAQEVAEEQEQNRLRMLEYSWTTRTELKYVGETRRLTTERVRHGAAGEIERTLIGDPIVPSKRQQKKAAMILEWGAKLLDTLDRYTLTSRDEIYSFLNTSTLTRDAERGLIRLRGVGVVDPNDTMTWWVEQGTRELEYTEVRTQQDTLDVEMDTEYARTEDGLSYTARAVVRIPALGIELIVENSDFEKP